MQMIHLLQHLHILANGEESIKIIGVYSSRNAGLAAIERLKTQPGLSDFPRLIDPLIDEDVSGFYIDEYELDQDHWPDGWFTGDPCEAC
ncbi:MAG: serine kinase [Thermoanaerobaculia bacterium]